MGFGDVTLMMMIGAFLGWQAGPILFFLSPFAGDRDRARSTRLSPRRCDSLRTVPVPRGRDGRRVLGADLELGPAAVRPGRARAGRAGRLPGDAWRDAFRLADAQGIAASAAGRDATFPDMAFSGIDWPATITDFHAGRERIRTRRYGVIETVGGRLAAIHLRPWPKLVALPELMPLDPRYHAAGTADRCLLYYNQPWRMPNYLALKYIVSTSGTSYATFRAALKVLDAIAELKRDRRHRLRRRQRAALRPAHAAARLGAPQAAALAPQLHPPLLRRTIRAAAASQLPAMLAG